MQHVISGRDRDNQIGMNTSPLIQTHQPEKPSSFDVIYLPPVRWQEYSHIYQVVHCCAQEQRVFLIEQPCFTHGPASLLLKHSQAQLWIGTPTLPKGTLPWEAVNMQRQMVDSLMADYRIEHYLLWYTQLETLAFTDHLEPLAIIYDSIDTPSHTSMDTLDLRHLKSVLLTYADIVLLSKESLNEMNRYHQKLVSLLSQPTGIEPMAPAWMLLEPPSSAKDCLIYWEKVWHAMKPVLDEIVAERSNWPCYSLKS